MDKLVAAINLIAQKYGVEPGESIEDTIMGIAEAIEVPDDGESQQTE